MTRKEIVQLLKKEEAEGNEQIINLLKLINLYLPNFLKYPESASIADVNRYNSLVRSNIYEKALLDRIIITK